MLLGDVNARVGSRMSAHDLLDGVRGPAVYGDTNDAGKELFIFLSAHHATTLCSKRGPFTNRHGSIPDPRNGTVLNLPSCDRRTGGDV